MISEGLEIARYFVPFSFFLYLLFVCEKMNFSKVPKLLSKFFESLKTLIQSLQRREVQWLPQHLSSRETGEVFPFELATWMDDWTSAITNAFYSFIYSVLVHSDVAIHAHEMKWDTILLLRKLSSLVKFIPTLLNHQITLKLTISLSFYVSSVSLKSININVLFL